MDWIGKVAKGKKPFLAVVWFGNPHSPHVAVDKFKNMYSDQPDGVAHFYGEITAMDAALGKMRSGLRKLGIADNTVLWYCSDNGSLPKGSSGGLRARKGSLYEGGIRVPAVLEWPSRVKANRITNINANTSDIYPTLLELAGVALPKNQPRLDGISLAPLLRGEKQVRKQPMGFWTYHNRGFGRHARRMLEALRQEQLAGNQQPAAAEGQIGHFHAADNLPGRPVHDPVPLAIARIVARYRQAAGEDHLRTATDLADDRRDVAARPVFTQRPPAFPAGLAAECDNVGIPIVVAVDNHEVLKQNRAGVEAMRAHEVADIGFPFLIPIEIVGRDDNFPRGDQPLRADVWSDHLVALGTHEGDVDLFAIRGRGTGRATVQAMNRLWR